MDVHKPSWDGDIINDLFDAEDRELTHRKGHEDYTQKPDFFF